MMALLSIHVAKLLNFPATVFAAVRVSDGNTVPAAAAWNNRGDA
jgi:hypothetical protein